MLSNFKSAGLVAALALSHAALGCLHITGEAIEGGDKPSLNLKFVDNGATTCELKDVSDESGMDHKCATDGYSLTWAFSLDSHKSGGSPGYVTYITPHGYFDIAFIDDLDIEHNSDCCGGGDCKCTVTRYSTSEFCD